MRYPHSALTLLCYIALCGSSGLADDQLAACEAQLTGRVHFDSQIAPILATRCANCHNGFDKKGGLDLTDAQSTRLGGDSGPPLTAEPGATSLLVQRIKDGEMPPDKPLDPESIRVLSQWIASGAEWGTSPIDVFRYSTDQRAGRDWWSLQPLASPQPPTSPYPAAVRNPIDDFVHARLAAAGLAPSDAADRRTLIRRLSFDLLGLPPEPGQVAKFLADDSVNAYEQLVLTMLDSPHYGERWARHWLDVARYGESDGFEYDRLRPHAWRYRDWVISALNRDLPYDQFAALQIAGDILSPGDPDAITATGFLVCGAHDSLIPQGDVMKKVMRQDTLEDFVGTISQTFLGMTTNCARCHDHKFDPIRQAEYYRLTAAVAGVTHGNRVVVPDRRRLDALQQQQQALERERQQILTRAVDGHSISHHALLASRPVAAYDFAIGRYDLVSGMPIQLRGGAAIVDGRLQLDGEKAFAVSEPIKRTVREKTLEVWVRLKSLDQQGGSPLSLQTTDGHSFDGIVFGEQERFRWMAGSEGFARTQSFEGTDETKANQFVHLAISYAGDGEIRAYRDGLPYGKPYRTQNLAAFQANDCQLLLGLRHGTEAVKGRMLTGGIARARLFDRALTAAEIFEAAQVAVPSRAAELEKLPAKTRTRLTEIDAKIDRIQAMIDTHPTYEVYAAAPKSDPPSPTYVLDRGNPQQPGVRVAAGGIAAVRGVSAAFGVAADAPDAQRRKALADWVTSPRNPLFARVIVNRIWHHHFGRGLVKTPNDFGFNGGAPSHPALLDWLARQMQSEGWSLKKLHFRIVTSSTYRQDSRVRPAAMTIDATNRWLWRFPSRRLDAEVIRDSILRVAGALNPAVGGPPFRDVRPYEHRGAQFYETLDPIGEAFQRRTVYRMWARGGRNPWLDAFDCPDPSSTAPQRAATTTPLQALAMLNNSFVLRMANQLAERLESEVGADIGAQVSRLYQLAYSRGAAADELNEARRFVARYGLPALCRAVFNSNEFLYLE